MSRNQKFALALFILVLFFGGGALCGGLATVGGVGYLFSTAQREAPDQERTPERVSLDSRRSP